jgi:hypothetical protein
MRIIVTNLSPIPLKPTGTRGMVFSEAYGTDEGTIRYKRDVSDFTDHAGWKGFFRPKVETSDGKLDKKKDDENTKKEKDEKYNMLLRSAERAHELKLGNAEDLFNRLAQEVKP